MSKIDNMEVKKIAKTKKTHWTPQVNVPVTPELHDQIRDKAEELGTSMAEIMRVAVKHVLDRKGVIE